MVQRRLPTERSNLAELKSLANAAGYTVVGSIEQVRNRDPTYQIGRGKINDLAEMVKATGADKVVFDNNNLNRGARD